MICLEHSTDCFIYNFVTQVLDEKKLYSKFFTTNQVVYSLHREKIPKKFITI